MKLEGKKAAEVAKDSRLKLFIYGQAKTGKTTAALGFPAPYFIDTEQGADKRKYLELLDKNDGVILQTSDYDKICQQILALTSTEHEFKTLVIDPITPVYETLLELSATKVGTEFGRHYGEANQKMKSMIKMLLRLDMNVIITCHSKVLYDTQMNIIGNTFDSYKKLDYLFDLILYTERRGKRRVAIVKGSRLTGFDEDDSFDISYDEISNRYSKDMMEKPSELLELASRKSVQVLTSLTQGARIPPESIQKWLAKAGVMSFSQMTEEDAQKCISFVEKKYPTMAA